MPVGCSFWPSRLHVVVLVIILHDKSVSTDYANGSVFTDYANGPVCTDYAKGSVFTDYANGVISIDYAYGSFCVDYANGSFSIDYAYRSVCTDYANGSVSTDYANGSIYNNGRFHQHFQPLVGYQILDEIARSQLIRYKWILLYLCLHYFLQNHLLNHFDIYCKWEWKLQTGVVLSQVISKPMSALAENFCRIFAFVSLLEDTEGDWKIGGIGAAPRIVPIWWYRADKLTKTRQYDHTER